MDSNALETIENLMERLREDIIPILQKNGSNGEVPLVKELAESFSGLDVLLKKQDEDLVNKDREIDHLHKELKRALKQINKKNKEIQEIMVTDRVTGLFNKDQLVTSLEEEIARCSRYGYPLAVMVVHIDNHKGFRDNYGHMAGDRVLAFAGNLIKNNIRKFDRAFRFGNEEFIIVLPETDLTLAFMAAERLRNSFINNTLMVSRNGDVPEKHISFSVSIGITATFSYTTESIGVEHLLEQADRALYQAKDNGGNTSVRYE